jgi:hypothetical protein
MDLLQLYKVELMDNYVTNVEAILEEVYQHPSSAFKDRSDATGLYKFNTICGKGASMSTMMYRSFSPRLKELCVETVDFGKFPRPTEIAINKYLPGSYLGKHRDGAGQYWKFQLIFLKSTKSHFTWYDKEDTPHLIEEIPGRGVEMPLHIVHESTEIGTDEEDKYSMVFVWK